MAENVYNNLPIGYSYSRYQDNTELLKILTPNILRIGRINSRALQGPIRLPASKKDLMEQVELTYQAWFRVFKETVVPRLISQPKWFRIDKDLKEKDLVYFQKEESALGSTWTIGQVDQVIISKDGLIRRAVIKYFNPNENHPRFSDRAARTLVKLWSLDESCLFDDLKDLHQRLHAKDAGQVDEVQIPVEPAQVPDVAGLQGVKFDRKLDRKLLLQTSPLSSVLLLDCVVDLLRPTPIVVLLM